MAKFKNTVWDSNAGAYVAWLSDDDYDTAGVSYPGPGTFGVDTSQYRRGEIYDAVISSASDNTAVHVDVDAEISGVTEKISPVSGDFILIEDSAASNAKKKVQVGNLPGGSGTDPDAIHDNVAAEISAIAAKAVPTTSDYLLIEDAAVANAKKSITIGDLPAAAPASHASTHNAGGGDALAIDAVAGTGSLRTLGAGAQQACAGNDSRLSDARTPTSHASSHNAGGGDALAIDAVAGTGSLRTLGTGSQQACAGDDARLSDNRTDADAIHTNVTGEINGLTEKASPVGADIIVIEDSAATYGKKKVQITNLPGGGVVLSDTAPVDVDPQAAAAGSAGEASRQDHKHDIVTATAGAATPGDAAAEGTANSLARSDHQHSLPAFGSLASTFCEGNDSRLSDARTPTIHATSHESGGGDQVSHQNLSGAGTNTHGQIDTHLGSTSNPHTVTAAQVGNTTAQWNADQLQGGDIDATLAPTDGQVLTYDGTGTQWTAASPAEGTSYLEMGQNHTITSAGGSPDSEDVGRGVFDASLHNTITFRAVLNSAYATTGSSSLKLYDDGSLTTPGTPRLVTTFTQTDDSLTYEVFEQALTVVASGPTTNEILGVGRVYRAVIEITATSSDTTTVSTVGFAAVGNGDVVTLSADAIQAIVMSLNA